MIGPGGEVVKQELEVGEVVEQQVVTMDGSIVQQVCSLLQHSNASNIQTFVGYRNEIYILCFVDI